MQETPLRGEKPSAADIAITVQFLELKKELEGMEKVAARLQCRAFDAQTNVQLLKDAVHVAEVTGIVKHPVLIG